MLNVNNITNQQMTTDWLLRVGDGENLKNSSKFKIWGISSKISTNKHFLKNVKFEIGRAHV